MKIKNFIVILAGFITISVLTIIWGLNGQQNDSIKNIVSQTQQHLMEIQVRSFFLIFIFIVLMLIKFYHSDGFFLLLSRQKRSMYVVFKTKNPFVKSVIKTICRNDTILCTYYFNCKMGAIRGIPFFI